MGSTSSSTKPAYFKSIQLLRFFAALYITLFHIGNWWAYKRDWLSHLFINGYGAIDLFFVISGFVVVQSAVTFNPGIRSFFVFLKKRFIRIYPIYWFFLLLFLAVGLVNSGGKANAWKAFFLLPGYSIILTTWTLRYELYFYLLIALYVLNNRSKFLLAALFAVSLISVAVSVVFSNSGFHFPGHGFYNEFVGEFFLGTFVYIIYKRIPFFIATLLLLAGLVLFFAPIKEFSSLHFISFGIPAAMLLAGLTVLEARQKITVAHWVVLLGDASYCLYLIHYPLSKFICDHIGVAYATNRFLLLLLVALIVALSVLLYVYVESPLLRYLNRHLITTRDCKTLNKK